MECSVIAEGYMNLGYSSQALELMLQLRRAALRHGGDFTLLWHNSHLLSRRDRSLMEALSAACVKDE